MRWRMYEERRNLEALTCLVKSWVFCPFRQIAFFFGNVCIILLRGTVGILALFFCLSRMDGPKSETEKKIRIDIEMYVGCK